jgi:hypothetical protein
MKAIILTLALVLTGGVFNAGAQSVINAFGGGEKLSYRITYFAKLIPNSEVGIVTLKTSHTSVNNIPAYKITGNARTSANFRWFFDLDDTYEVWLNAESGLPIKFLSRLKESKYRFRSDFVYDWDSMRVHTVWRNLKRPDDKTKTMPLTKHSFDALSLFYNLRNHDIDKFVPNEWRHLEMVLEDTIRTVGYKFICREKKTFRGLGTFNTLKFVCQLATSSAQSFEDGSEFTIWISDDGNKIPLCVESPIRIGSVRVLLYKAEGLKHKFSSKL